MVRPAVLVLVLLASVPSVAALQADDVLALAAATDDPGGCVHIEDESEEGPVKLGQEEPGVFVGIPGVAATDGEGATPLSGPFSGVGVFYRNRDCELPGLGDLDSLAPLAL